MTNIIDIDAIGWKTEDYEDAYVETGEIEQHLVKVADYVSLKGSESETATASSESSYLVPTSMRQGAGSQITRTPMLSSGTTS